MGIAHYSELRIYSRPVPADLSPNLLATLPASNVSFSVEVDGGGFLSASFSSLLDEIVATPGLLDDCLIKLAIPLEDGEDPVEVELYVPRSPDGVLLSGKRSPTREVVAAPTATIAWLQDAVLHPESNSIGRRSAEDRWFGYMSTRYEPSDYGDDWDTPGYNVAQNATTGRKAGQPSEPKPWPDWAGGARWITRGATTNGLRHLFIADLVIADDTTPIRLICSSDESISVYLASELVAQTQSDETGYTSYQQFDTVLDSGTYRVAIDKTSIVSLGGDGVDPVLLAIAEIDDAGEAVGSPLLTTNATDWQVFTLDPEDGEAPSLSPGAIAAELFEQAQARNVTTFDAMTIDFDDFTDSNDDAWEHREERVWRVAFDSYADMLEGLGDLPFVPRITPGYVFQAFVSRGADVSGSVTIEALVGLAEAEEQGAPISGNYMPVLTQDGWVLTAASSSQTTYGRREIGLSLGNAPSVAQGKRLGSAQLELISVPTSEWSIEFYAVEGCVPFLDFNVGDVVTVSIGGVGTERQVLALAGTQGHTSELIRWSARLGDAP